MIQITRVDRPDVAGVGWDSFELAGQWEWCWAVPLPYRVIAAPGAGNAMPAAPRVGQDLRLSLGYWGALQSFLTYSFGWTRHDRGLRWWLGEGRPLLDPRLELIDLTWHADGNLLPYAEWFHDRAAMFGQQPLAQWTDYDSQPDELSPEFAAAFRRLREFETLPELSPHGKHLENGDHVGGPAAEGYSATLTGVDIANRSAIYISDSMRGWYRGLMELGDDLPHLGNASWHVEVFVKPVGYMGMFRRSRKTGLWFSGRHLVHAAGV